MIIQDFLIQNELTQLEYTIFSMFKLSYSNIHRKMFLPHATWDSTELFFRTILCAVFIQLFIT